MEPLQAIPMPTHGVLIEITNQNSWQSGQPGNISRIAFIATDSTHNLSFISLQIASRPETVLRLASRPAFLPGYEYGLVVEVYLTQDLTQGQAVSLHLAQSGATLYFPPQPIQD